MGKRKRKVTLITGGAGFIGSHLCDLLVKKGHKVICLDNFVTGKKENIKHLLANPLFEFKKINVSRGFNIKGNIDFILHFASPASPVDYLKNPIETLKVGSFGTYNCLNLALVKKAKFLLASTSEIYGDPLQHPQKESYWGNVNSIGPRSVYDEAKRFAEAITMSYLREHKVDTKIVRIFNTYGPRMQSDDGRAVPSFIMQALRNKPVTIQGDGSQTRSFCYVSDLIEGIFRLMNSNINEPVNLGNPVEVSINKLAKIIIGLANSDSAMRYLPLPQDDPARRKPDISRARKYLNWQPEVDLKDGLIATIGWFKQETLRY
ncbi:MAG: SDR family oxidoreductase [Candidatus Omnitrophica bacterium]|nr:SDR family oxidoreductase [Candidatus Omnitrophota bacterium]MDD5356130.1 SDR family oxidoreductase [Candidatus Omnitrophota bacterium]